MRSPTFFGYFAPNVIGPDVFEIDRSSILFIINHLFEHKKAIPFL